MSHPQSISEFMGRQARNTVVINDFDSQSELSGPVGAASSNDSMAVPMFGKQGGAMPRGQIPLPSTRSQKSMKSVQQQRPKKLSRGPNKAFILKKAVSPKARNPATRFTEISLAGGRSQ